MAAADRRRRSRSGQLVDALVWGAVLGAASGAVLGDAVGGVGAGAGAVIGVALCAPAEAITTLRRGAAAIKPLWQRIFSSALLMALFGWLLGVILGSGETLLTAILTGALLGLLGLRPLKLALGLLVGALLGVLLQDAGLEPALVAAAVAVAYRVLAAIAYRDRPLVRVMAEEVPASQLRYVVPGAVHPLIREFYEHTSRFRLSIIPEWRPWMRPGYEVFNRLVAQPLGQAAIPSNIEEAQRGMVSTIDTIALEEDEEIEIRGWIRTFADSGKPIYVGIYTTFRHEDCGYVSVGFPIPNANFTATLLPRNAGEHDFVLTSRSELAFPGHYLSGFLTLHYEIERM